MLNLVTKNFILKIKVLSQQLPLNQPAAATFNFKPINSINANFQGKPNVNSNQISITKTVSTTTNTNATSGVPFDERKQIITQVRNEANTQRATAAAKPAAPLTISTTSNATSSTSATVGDISLEVYINRPISFNTIINIVLFS